MLAVVICSPLLLHQTTTLLSCENSMSADESLSVQERRENYLTVLVCQWVVVFSQTAYGPKKEILSCCWPKQLLFM